VRAGGCPVAHYDVAAALAAGDAHARAVCASRRALFAAMDGAARAAFADAFDVCGITAAQNERSDPAPVKLPP
jgi:hypothetical protein